jgi:PIN domain nuclease of toxin-antitoxin system
MARPRRSSAASDGATMELMPRRVLLDTQAWLWMQADDPRLGVRARRVIQQAAELRLSAASVWEIAIKTAIGKLTLPPGADIEGELEHTGIRPLLIDFAHANHVRQLPPLHRDPFDRLLVAQTLIEGLALLSADTQLAAYGVPVVDARL